MIKFGGVNLLMPDPWGAFGPWLDQYLPLEDMRLFGPSASMNGFRTGTRTQHYTASVNVPVGNWPAPPRAKLNTLYWPSGASRWAVGLFLASADQKTAVMQAVGTGRYGDLVLGTSNEATVDTGSITASMCLLAPRPLSVPDVGKGLWLLPLVDQRYWWQYKDATDSMVSNGTSTTWDDMYGFLATALGVSITRASVSASYLLPDPIEMTRRFENPAVLLDAVAWSCGQRIVRDLDGTVRALSAAQGGTRLTNLASYQSDDQEYFAVAGSKNTTSDVLLPAQVKVVFRKFKTKHAQADGTYYTITKTGSTYTSLPTVSGTSKTVFDTMAADYTSGSLDNSSALDALATQIATDFYAWGANAFDVSLGGIKNFSPSGFEDYLWYHVGGLSPNPQCGQQYEAYTRIASLPANWQVEEMLHQASDAVKDWAKWIHFTLPSALATTDASKASCTVYDYWQGGSPGSTVTVYNPAASSNYIFAGDSGARGLACYDDIEDKYKIVQLQC